jgi:crotonobetainyl-CoA:carnitine CoA-transferase CaiB-like acyl-CoA transferase
VTDPQQLPLNGLRIVDLTQVVSGAVATAYLGQLGADIIKVEPPGGEAYRRSGYPLAGEHGSTNLNFLRFSAGKRSIVLDLKAPDGRAVLESLLSTADVLVENFRPGVLAKLGFSAEQLRRDYPALIYTTVSGFGHEDLYPSPLASSPAYAIVCEAMAGIMALNGDPDGPPTWIGFAMADIFAGTLALAGTLTALYRRRDTGRGGRVDISMFDGAVTMNELAMAYHFATGEDMGRGSYSLQAPWGSYPASDGWVVIAVLTEQQWRGLCRVLDAPDLAGDERLGDGRSRARNEDELIRPVLEKWTAERTRAELVALLGEAGVPAAPVNSASDVAAHPQAAARQLFEDIEDPAIGRARVVASPLKLDGVAVQPGRRVPALGEHSREILGEVGYSDEQIDSLLGGAVQ